MLVMSSIDGKRSRKLSQKYRLKLGVRDPIMALYKRSVQYVRFGGQFQAAVESANKGASWASVNTTVRKDEKKRWGMKKNRKLRGAN